MDLFSIINTLLELLGAIDAYSSSSKNLARSLKTLKDKLTSTQELLIELEGLAKAETCDITPSPSHGTPANSNQSSPTLQLIKEKGQLQVLQATLNDISAWLDALGSKSKSKKLRPHQDDERRVDRFLVELERCKLTAGLVLSRAIRYAHETAEQRS